MPSAGPGERPQGKPGLPHLGLGLLSLLFEPVVLSDLAEKKRRTELKSGQIEGN